MTVHTLGEISITAAHRTFLFFIFIACLYLYFYIYKYKSIYIQYILTDLMLRFSALERLACLFTVYMQKCDYYYDYNSVFPTLPPQTCLSQFGFLCWRTDPTCLIRIFSTCREKYGCKCELLFRSLVLEFWTFVNEFLVLDPAQFESLMLQTICCIWLIKIKIFNQL